MSQEQIQLVAKTQQLLHGPLKHVRAAALAAALLPLASVAVSPASAQESCQSGGTCGVVFLDTNNNGIQEEGEPGIAGAVVTTVNTDGTLIVVQTDTNGFFEFFLPGQETLDISVQIPNGTQASPPNEGVDDSIDSDGVSDGAGNSVAEDVPGGSNNVDFGFSLNPVAQPGTGTPGYWKNHPEAWPAGGVTIGGKLYTTAQAIAVLDSGGKDKTTTMFSSLVSAKLNVIVGNDPSCVESTIAKADDWMRTFGPPAVGGVHASSLAWKQGEPLHRLMDNYNNGMLCAPHRD
jgi:hypothetical protein